MSIVRRPAAGLVDFWLNPPSKTRRTKTPDLHLCRSGASVGAACRNRTDDLVITSDSLYRLS
jgi:hypothetical protein